MNLHAYVSNNPVFYLDPFGLDEFDVVLGPQGIWLPKSAYPANPHPRYDLSDWIISWVRYANFNEEWLAWWRKFKYRTVVAGNYPNRFMQRQMMDSAEASAEEIYAKQMLKGNLWYFRVTSISDAHKQLVESCDKNDCIKSLRVHGHAGDGKVIVGNKFPEDEQASKLLQWKDGKAVGLELFKSVKFCNSCTIELVGCDVGAGPAGEELILAIKALPNVAKANCKVVAACHKVYVKGGKFTDQGGKPLRLVDPTVE